MAHNEEINKAFRRLEQREREAVRKKEEAQRKQELAQLEAVRHAAFRRKKMIERATLGITLAFVCIIAWVIWTAKGDEIKREYRELVAGISGRGMQVDCEAEKYRDLPICVSRIQTEANWTGISRHFGGKQKPFSLHKNGKEGT